MLMLWLPVLVSAVLVFLASSILHMASPWHKSDYPRLANEDAVMDALRPLGIPPGDYMMPRAANSADMKSPAFQEKYKRGPVTLFTIMPPGPMSMGRNLALWFVYLLVVTALAALIAGVALAPGADPHVVFHVIALATFLGYAAALWQMSIWWRRAWRITLKATLDAVIYALIAAGTFVWLWPH